MNFGQLLPLNSVTHWNSYITKNLDGEYWSCEGWSGDPKEPYRHWCKYPKFEGIYEEIWQSIEPALREEYGHLEPERVIVNAYNHGDSSWLHRDANDYTAIVYLNTNWDMNWGGETVLVEDGGDILMSVFPTPGRVILFDGTILHGPRPVSREAPFPRLGVAFQCTKR